MLAKLYASGFLPEVWVPDEATLALLRSYGVDFAQGYFIGRPLPAYRGIV